MPALRVAMLLVLVVAVALPQAQASAAEPVRPADSFVDSIGINVHMNYRDTVYRDAPRLIDKMAELGVRHARDGLSWDTEYAYGVFNRMADRGIHTTFIMGEPRERADTLEELLAVLRTKVPRAAEAVEGPNEYHHRENPPWHEELRNYQRRLYSRMKNDPTLPRIPVLAPSLVTWQDHAEVGDLRDAIDFGNKHPYAGGEMPEANLDQELSVAARVSGDLPIHVTESGYHNALATTRGHRPTSEAATATYLPRMFLEHFRRGVPRTFSYELIDLWPDPAKSNQEANFGLLRNDYSEKPAFRSLKNLIALLADGGGAHQVAPLDFTIPDAPADLRKLVLQKRDGSYYVVLWRAVRIWDPVARKPVAADRRTATLQLAGTLPAGSQAEIFSPSTTAQRLGTAPVAGGIPVSLGADPVVIRVPPMSPATAAPPPQSNVIVLPGQRVEEVLTEGLVVKCWSTAAGACRTAAVGKRRVIGKGRRRALRPRRSARVRMKTTKQGRRVLRRAARKHRGVTVQVRADFGRGRVVTKRLRLRR